MFLTATKVSIVNALRSIWFDDNQDPNNYKKQLTPDDQPYPRRITIEYPEEPEDWPFILVQIRPTVIQWTGITPDETVDASNKIDFRHNYQPMKEFDNVTGAEIVYTSNEAPVYKSIRQGRFEATCMLQILSTESQTRDRLWDNLVSILLMGRKRSRTRNFYTVLDENEYVGLTVIEGSIRNVGDTISMGVPWQPEMMQYEAALEFDIVGTFYADEYNEDLVPLEVALLYDYIEDVETLPFEEDLHEFNAAIVNAIPSSTDPVIDIQLTQPVEEYMVRKSGDAVVNNIEYDVLWHQWIASIDDEKFMVLMVGSEDRTLLRVSRAQFNTYQKKHKAGAEFIHEGTNWKTWMA